MKEQDTGQREAQGGLSFLYKAIKLPLAIYKQCAYILAFKYTDQVGYVKMKKGLHLLNFSALLRLL